MNPNVLLIGDGPTAPSALRSLSSSCEVLGVIRAQVVTGDQISEWANQRAVPLHEGVNLSYLHRIVDEHRPDAVIISSFGRVIPPRTLRLSKFINVHYSPLPRYRGRANVNWALINGERTAAITIHIVDDGLDNGGILYQEEVHITPHDTATSIYERLNTIQQRELGAALLKALAGEAGKPQDERDATYGCARIPDDGEIDWRLTTSRIDNLIRALSPPFPAAFTFLEGRKLQIARAEPRLAGARYEGRVPGRIVGVSQAEGWVDVLTGDGLLRIFELRTDGGLTIAAAAIIPSTRMTLGLSRLALLRQIDGLEKRVRALEYLHQQHVDGKSAGCADVR